MFPVANAVPPVSFANHEIVPAEVVALNETVPVPILDPGLVPVMVGVAATFTEALLNRIRLLEQELVAKLVIVIVVLPEFASTTVVKDPVPAVVTFIVAVFPVEELVPDTL